MEMNLNQVANELSTEAVEKIEKAIIDSSDVVAENFGTTSSQLLGYAVDGVRIEGLIVVALAMLINITAVLVFKKLHKQADAFDKIKDKVQGFLIAVFVTLLVTTNFLLYNNFKDGLVAAAAPEYTIMKLVGGETYKAIKKD